MHGDCPDGMVFDMNLRMCDHGDCMPVNIEGLHGNACSDAVGFFCNSFTSFTYCTSDNMKIVENEPCPNDTMCNMENNNPCIS
jgi:hypothetical protein